MTNCYENLKAAPPTQQTKRRQDLTQSKIRMTHTANTKREVSKSDPRLVEIENHGHTMQINLRATIAGCFRVVGSGRSCFLFS